MKISFCVTFRTLFVASLWSSCIIFTLATAEVSNLEGRIISSNSSLDLEENETLPETIASPPVPPAVPALVDVIHGKNTVVHEIHGSIDELHILMKTEIKPEDSLSSSTEANISEPPSKEAPPPPEQFLPEEVGNITEPEAPTQEPQPNATAGGTQDDIPSFSEWAKKHMAEAGRAKGENLTVGNTGGKLRFKNYASPDCGAKVVASNPEALSPSAILSSTRDDYMLNPCNVKIWFVVELCEPIQPQRIEIANFELFSSSPQELSVYTSDRYPSRDWAQTGALTAKDERTIQSFQLPRVSHFVKYLKVELHSHYGSEHYCPISLFRAYGTSEIEVLETVDGEESDPEDDDEEDVGKKRDLLEELEIGAKGNEAEKNTSEQEKSNLFGSAKAAVLSIVKKAAEVLVKTPGNDSSACSQGGLQYKHCFTPGYQVICSNCSDNFYSKLYDMLCCHGTELQCLLSNPFVNSVVSDTQLCKEIGLDWKERETPNNSNSSTSNYSTKVEYLKAFLPRETIAALCNYLAVTRRKVVLNVTHAESSKDEPKADNTTNGVEPKEALNEPQKEQPVIHPTKVEAEETSTFSEAIKEEDPSLPDPSPAISEPHLNVTVSPVTPLPVELNETNDKVPSPEEMNNTIQVVETNGDEPVTIDSLALDSLFPETEEEQEQEVAKVKQEDVIEQEEAKVATVTVQKESVFVRLANRIKALEVNMSLSSQYLEELSRRYKKQVEELQRNLNSVLEDRRLAAERESIQSAQLAALTQKVEMLSVALSELIAERDSWSNKALVFGQHGLIVFLEVIGFIVLVWVWRKLGPTPPKKQPEVQNTPHLTRRHSAEEPHKRNTTRRPSEEACLPSGGTHKELLTEAPKRKVSRDGARKRKRRRKGGDIVVIGGGEGDWQPLEPAPEFMKTAMWHRGKRSSQTQTSSSQEALSVSSDTSKPKKSGAFRKIVKKLF